MTYVTCSFVAHLKQDTSPHNRIGAGSLILALNYPFRKKSSSLADSVAIILIWLTSHSLAVHTQHRLPVPQPLIHVIR